MVKKTDIFRPMREDERKRQLERIDEARETASAHLYYLHSLEHELEEGVWVGEPTDPVVAAAARERLAKVEKGRTLEHFESFKIGDKVRHIFDQSTGTVIRIDNFTTAAECCLPAGPTILVEPDGEHSGDKFYHPEHLEIVEEGIT